jgi:antitoxin component HigA of HigAB toxin-antitoxin module
MGASKKIKTKDDYHEVMARIDELMAKGSSRVSKKELAEIRSLAMKAQQYEQQKYVIEPPTTLAGIIELKMYERKLKQKDLAKELNVSTAKLSLILSGKQKPDVDFLKAVHQRLGVNGDFLLKVV